jgi:hypothetical protein
MNEKWVVAFSNPFDGLYLVGPFDTHEEAIEYAEANSPNTEWHIVKLQTPD